MAAGQNRDALDVFQLNFKRNGDAWPVHVGLARGLSANGDKKTALVHAGLRALIEHASAERLRRLAGSDPTASAPRRRRPAAEPKRRGRGS